MSPSIGMGTTISDWVRGSNVRLNGPEGLPIHKPPYNKITAIDMNTGERLFDVPVGEPSSQLTEHPALQGIDPSSLGGGRPVVMMATGSLLLATEGSNGASVLNAHDKRTGEKLGSVDIPAPGQYGMMTYMHEGRQYIVVQIAKGGQFPGSLAALALAE